MSNLTSITTYCGQLNLPGLRLLEYLPIDYLADGEYEEFITSANNFNKAIVPSLGGAEWLTLPFMPGKGDGWEEGDRRTDQGPEYAQDIAGVIKGLRPEVTGEFQKMAGRRFLVKFTDRNARPWLVGRLWEPLDFTAQAQTGSGSGGLASYNFRFSGITTKRAFGYVPVF